ncbi:hypothetical protein [Pyxidicoccus xibeiensis]|uniref:hypothetical protein n=1 Tax=Pyxidicoccus xibeiensis TaxID=2906759 RepID=UPI0020A77AD8|nr:hypothetical protein [Pyxidicoccus xibeiensis]MCP3141397.1 hypothetical protein [Pyxidicoccus xibeiensis]
MSEHDGQQDPPASQGGASKDAERGPTGHGEAMAREVWEEVREGALHFHLRNRKVPPGRVRQFIHGLSLPFHLARALMADPMARGRYLRVGLLQTVAALALALTCMGSGKKAAENASERSSQASDAKAIRAVTEAVVARHLENAETKRTRQQEKVDARVDEILRNAGVTPPARRRRDAGTGATVQETTAAGQSQQDAGAVATSQDEASAAAVPSSDAGAITALEDEASAGPLPAPDAGAVASGKADAGDAPALTRDEARAQAAQARMEQRIRDLEAAVQGGDAGTSLSEAISALVLETAALAEAPETEDEDEDEDGGPPAATRADPPQDEDGEAARDAQPKAKADTDFFTVKGFSLWGLAFWGALFAALQLSQWVVIALSREHHDAIARDASLLTGVPPEDEELTPRIRVDVPWIRKKVKRRWRAFMLFLVGVPAMVVLTVPFLFSRTMFSILSTLWGGWWLIVFTAAKSGQAWEAVGEPQTPWFLRAWTWLTTKVPGLRWGMLQRYGALVTRRTQEVIAPVATVERHPWAFAGLTLVRFLGTFPPMKFFIRPLIPVASAHLLADEAAARAALKPAPPKPAIPAGETGS